MQTKCDAAHSIIRLTGIPVGWQDWRLGEAIRIVGGGTPDRNEGAYWRDGTIPWITPTDLTSNDGKYIAEGAEYVSDIGLRNSNAALVPPGSIVFSTRGTVGNMAIAKVPLTSNQSCEILIARDGKTDGEFLYYLLTFGMSAFLRLSAGTTFGAITRRDIARVHFAFPPRQEQAEIARILDAVDTAIERTRLAIDRAREVKRALVQELFSKGVRRERQKKTVVGYIPQSWEVATVASAVSEFQYGLSVSMQLHGALPVLRMGNLQQGEILLEDLKHVTIPERVVAPYRLRRGDVLFNRVNSQEHVGKVGIYRSDEDCVFASYLIRVIPDPMKADNYFLGQLLNSHDAQCRIKRYATPGVQQVNINATNLGKVLIPLPMGATGLDEQREIAAILEQADAIVRNYGPVLTAQETLKKSLMHDLLTGRVRVTALLETKRRTTMA